MRGLTQAVTPLVALPSPHSQPSLALSVGHPNEESEKKASVQPLTKSFRASGSIVQTVSLVLDGRG